MSRPKKDGPGRSREVLECATCHRSLSGERYVRCERCVNFRQCLACLSIGAEANLHKYTHRFYVVDPCSDPICRENWTREEEIQLLYGVKALGIGNWDMIAGYLQTKTAEEVEVHYMTDFVLSPTAPLPGPGVGPELPLPPPPPFDTGRQESNPVTRKHNPTETYAEQCEWMPFRHEFDSKGDFECDAEMVVANLVFAGKDETRESFAMKVQQLLSYNEILTERQFRTRVIEEWGLQDRKLPNRKGTKGPVEPDDVPILGGVTREDKAVDAQICMLAPYIGRNMMTEFADSLHRALKSRDMIRKRKQWQANGVTTISEGQLWSWLKTRIVKDRVPVSDFEMWNAKIKRYKEEYGTTAVVENTGITAEEHSVYKRYGIDSHMYMAFKDLLIREYTIFRSLSKEQAMKMVPQHQEVIAGLYDFFARNGWIGE